MKLVMTLLVRDEEDLIEAHLDYHFRQGVDFMIVTDNLSRDRTPEILARFARRGRIRVIEEACDDYSQGVWVTRMARLARVDYGADWVINSDADEFWWPLEGDLKSTLAALPSEVGGVSVPRLNFVPRPVSEGELFERMVFREVVSANPCGDPLPPKVCHRAHPEVVIEQGNHRLSAPALTMSPHRPPLTIFHFPMRTYPQFESKIISGGQAYRRNISLPEAIGNTWRVLYRRYLDGTLRQHYEEHEIGENELKEGIRAGRLIRDERLLRFLHARVPGRQGMPRRPAAESSSGLRNGWGDRSQAPFEEEVGAALSIDGFMKESELRVLMKLAAEVPPEDCIVEIGTYRGRTTVALACGARRGNRNRLYTFDPHVDFEGARGGTFGPIDQAHLFQALLEVGVAGLVSVVCLDSKLVASSWPAADVGLLVIDGDHRYAGVAADVRAWWSRLSENAVVVFDDADFPDVDRLLREITASGALAPLGRQDQLAWFRLRARNALCH